MGKLKASQPEKFGYVTKAHLVAQSAQEYLKHNVGWYFQEVEWRSRALIKTAFALPAPKHEVSQFGRSTPRWVV